MHDESSSGSRQNRRPAPRALRRLLDPLADHEKLFIWRRRQGLTQKEFAALIDIGISTYERLERGAGRVRPEHIYVAKAAAAGVFGWSLSCGEACTILRRQSELTQARVAKDLGVSRYWVHRMECDYATPDRLLTYWGFDD